jgi:hypothetical protein
VPSEQLSRRRDRAFSDTAGELISSTSSAEPPAIRGHERQGRLMKTMTCKQLGGPCDFPHHGHTADEVIKAQDKHLNEVVAQGDATHESALKEMKSRWSIPLLE